ncbi:hypothetical protein [Natrinema gari]|uniref:hypothetical protein n=1 Tax=Natrinema gari TaxID=419186 RepID=UPI00135F15CA|nr:hypothetical protein [Natrinema gari]
MARERPAREQLLAGEFERLDRTVGHLIGELVDPGRSGAGPMWPTRVPAEIRGQ